MCWKHWIFKQTKQSYFFSPHPLQTEVFVQPPNDAALSLQRTACTEISTRKPEKYPVLLQWRHEYKPTRQQPQGWKQQRVRRPLEASQYEFFTGETGGGRRLLSTTSLLPPLPLPRWDEKLTAAPASSRMVLQSCLSQQTYLFQLIAESF